MKMTNGLTFSPILSTMLMSLPITSMAAQQQPAQLAPASMSPGRATADEEQLPVRSEPSDDEITDAVEDELQSDAAVVPTFIDVTTTGGVVTLTGSVDNLLAKQRAARLTTAVRGVRAVVNLVEVREIGRSNPAVERDIDDALLLDPATESYDVEVDVAGGQAAKLTGQVASYAEKELAGRVAKGVRGVRSLDNQIRVVYAIDRADMEIVQDVKGRLRWSRFIDDALVKVSVDDGIVACQGVVGSASEKRLLADHCWVAGVKSVVVDDVAVKRWARDDDLRGDKYAEKTDGQIEQAVTAAMRHDPRVFSFQVRTDVDGGRATLRGQVDNLKAKRAAEQDAHNCVGVWSVNNRLKVRPVVDVDDEAVQLEIERALQRDPWVEAFEILVAVDNGNVRLYGTVDTQFDKARADDAAARVAGVAAVENMLIVSTAGSSGYDPYIDDWYTPTDFPWYDHYTPVMTIRGDEGIRAAIRDRLWWSPFVNDGDVRVRVEDGCATLSGSVDSLSESMAAVENAYEGGAVRVVNHLTVGGGGGGGVGSANDSQ